mmetsp:Transcript_69121/g.218642  ORF Transcript_69121/g.218642 Transcript_69121/m.218642 type:complete len:248 (+) Transcript_69121:356-1099(+)
MRRCLASRYDTPSCVARSPSRTFSRRGCTLSLTSPSPPWSSARSARSSGASLVSAASCASRDRALLSFSTTSTSAPPRPLPFFPMLFIAAWYPWDQAPLAEEHLHGVGAMMPHRIQRAMSATTAMSTCSRLLKNSLAGTGTLSTYAASCSLPTYDSSSFHKLSTTICPVMSPARNGASGAGTPSPTPSPFCPLSLDLSSTSSTGSPVPRNQLENMPPDDDEELFRRICVAQADRLPHGPAHHNREGG